jgi:hypothetical protein
MGASMKEEAIKLADQLENECEPYVQLDQITFHKAARMLRDQANLIQHLKSQLIYDRLVRKLDGSNH